MYVCVCMYIYIYIYVCVCIYVCVSVRGYKGQGVCVRDCECAYSVYKYTAIDRISIITTVTTITTVRLYIHRQKSVK